MENNGPPVWNIQPNPPSPAPLPTGKPNTTPKAAPETSSCWCRGLAWRWVSHHHGFDKQYCPCPFGQQLKIEERDSDLERAWNQADIPERFRGFTLESSPVGYSLRLLTESRHGFAITRESYFFHGPYGVGKTGLAVGYARAVLENDVQTRIKFVGVPDLLGFLRASYDDETTNEENIIQRYIEPDLLILDDLGAEQIKNSEWIQDRLYRILGKRHSELKATVITSNLNIKELGERIGERITWRIIESCGDNIIEIQGPNLRDA